MLEVIDGVLNLIEPGGVIDPVTDIRPATSGTSVDHAAAKPFEVEFEVDRLYAWPGSDRHVTMESGRPPSIQERFTIDLAYVVASLGEQARARRRRSVSAAIDTKLHAYLAVIADNVQFGALWDDLAGEINPDVIRGFDVRAGGIRLTGRRYLEGV